MKIGSKDHATISTYLTLAQKYHYHPTLQKVQCVEEKGELLDHN